MNLFNTEMLGRLTLKQQTEDLTWRNQILLTFFAFTKP